MIYILKYNILILYVGSISLYKYKIKIYVDNNKSIECKKFFLSPFDTYLNLCKSNKWYAM